MFFYSFQAQHEGLCDYEQVQCEACKTLILRIDKERHADRECEARTLNCKYCKVSFTYNEIKVGEGISPSVTGRRHVLRGGHT